MQHHAQGPRAPAPTPTGLGSCCRVSSSRGRGPCSAHTPGSTPGTPDTRAPRRAPEAPAQYTVKKLNVGKPKVWLIFGTLIVSVRNFKFGCGPIEFSNPAQWPPHAHRARAHSTVTSQLAHSPAQQRAAAAVRLQPECLASPELQHVAKRRLAVFFTWELNVWCDPILVF